MKYEIRIVGGVVSVVDVVDDLLENVDSVLSIEENATPISGSIEANGDGRLLGKVILESDKVISSRVVTELEKQFPGIGFELAEVA
jgi:hypothetical protein